MLVLCPSPKDLLPFFLCPSATFKSGYLLHEIFLVFLISCHVWVCNIPSFFSFTKPSLIVDFFFCVCVCNNWLLLSQQLKLVYKAQSRNTRCFFLFVRNAVENHSRLGTWKGFCSEIQPTDLL